MESEKRRFPTAAEILADPDGLQEELRELLGELMRLGTKYRIAGSNRRYDIVDVRVR